MRGPCERGRGPNAASVMGVFGESRPQGHWSYNEVKGGIRNHADQEGAQ